MNATANEGARTMRNVPEQNHVQRSWRQELLLVDFRHAFWPWLAYLAGCGVFASIPPSAGESQSGIELVAHWFGSLIIIVFAVPAIIAQIYSTDFSHHTSQSLLTFPRQRKAIWQARTALLLALLFVPLAAAGVVFQVQMYALGDDTVILALLAALTLQTIYCQITFGALLAVVLRKKLVAWSAIVVSPLVLNMVAQLVHFVLRIEGSDPEKVTKTFPYLPPFQFWFIIIIGIPAIILAYRQWIGLEVRS